MYASRSSSVLLISLVLGLQGAGCGSDATGPRSIDACGGPVTDEECYALRRDPSSEQVALATAIALRHIDRHPATTQSWNWTSGVFMFALTELYRVTGDARLPDYYKEYLDHHIDEGYELVWSDSCPPALTALALLREAEDSDYRRVVDDVLAYLRNAPRTAEGGINHLGTVLPSPPAIWIDSLFMFGMVLNRHGEAAADARALDAMSDQLDIFADVLQSESGLLVHADDWIFPFDTDVYWARGNGWVTASLADYLRIRSARNERDTRAEQVFRAQVAGILATQDADSGLWWTVVNRPGEGDNYMEPSAAALYAYGIARAYRYGFLGEDELAAAKRAVGGVRKFIETDGEGRPFVAAISAGTEPNTFEGYTGVEVEDDLDYGVGAVILALLETSGL